MNAPFVLAQATGTTGQTSAAQPRVVKLAKPQGEQAIVIQMDGNTKLDFSSIASEKITLVRNGERLVILFDNKSTVTIDPFFDSSGKPLQLGGIELDGNQLVTGEQFAALFPITDDQSILPAAGEQGPQNTGSQFAGPNVDPLNPFNPLDLLGPEELGNFVVEPDTNPLLDDFVDLFPSQITTGRLRLTVEEEHQDGFPSEGEEGPSFRLLESAGGIGGNEDPNDVSAPGGGANPDGQDQDTNGNNDNTTLTVHGSGVNALTSLISGGNGPLTFSVIDVVNDANSNNDAVKNESGGDVYSQGEQVFYTVYDALVPGETTIEAWTNPGEGEGRLIFTLTVEANGEWTFTLFDQIDHPIATLDDGTVSQGDLEEFLGIDLTSLIQAVDTDGDVATLVPVNGEAIFVLNVVDDTPIVLEGAEIRSVNEDDISTYGDGIPGASLGTSPNDGPFDGSFTGSPFNNGIGPATIFGSLAGFVKVGADEVPLSEANPSGVTFSFLTGAAQTAALAALNGLGLESKGADIVFSFEGGNLVGKADGRLVMQLSLDANGDYTFELYDQVDHDRPYDDFGDFPQLPGDDYPEADQNHDLQDGINGDVVFIDFGSIIKASDYDGDGVVLEDKLLIKVTDDIPVVRDCDPIVLRVDEDDIVTNHDGIPGGSLGNHPEDGNSDGSYTGSPNNENGGPATVFGSLTSVVDPGADEGLTFSFVHNTVGKLLNLGLESQGKVVSYEIENGAIIAFVNANGQVGQSYDPQDGDRLVFRFELDASSGDFAFKLYDQLDHDAPNYGSDQNYDLEVPGPDIYFIDFGRLINATDFDGDSVNLDDMLLVKIRDDVPEIKCGEKVFGVVEEEHLHKGNEDFTANPDLDQDHPQPGNDYNDTTTVVSGSGANSLLALVKVGADENGKFTLKWNVDEGDYLRDDCGCVITSEGQNVKITGIDHGHDQNGNYVLITYGTGYHDDVLILKIWENGNWRFELEDQLDHNPFGDNQEGLLKLDFSGLIKFTDFDGDSVSLEGGSFIVKVIDDVPVADLDLKHGAKLLLDETKANSPQDTQSDPNADDEEGVSNPFGSYGSLIGYAKGSSGSLFVDNSSIGADQNGDKSFSLQLDFGQNDSTHLKDASTNQNILLKMVGGNIVGYFVDGNVEYVSFVITVDSNDGDVRVYQYRSIEHDNAGSSQSSHDESSSPEILNDGLVYLQVTVTDEDGDTDTDSIDIGQVIKFEDDGPKVGSNDKVELEDDDLPPNGIDGGAGDDWAPDNATGTLSHNYGTDGPGSIKLTSASYPSGNNFSQAVTDGGSVLTISQNGTPVLKITIDATTGAYEVEQLAPISHPTLNGQSGDNTENNVEFTINYRVTDSDGDYANGTIKIDVDDDMPNPTFVLSSGKIIHDETSGVDVDANDTNTDLSGLFALVTTKGNDPDVNNALEPAIGYAQSAGAIVAVTPNYGADGPGSTTFAIDVPGIAPGNGSVDSGLRTTDGRAIYLFEINSTLVVGRYEDDNNTTPETNDPAAFAIHIDPVTGVITVAQYVSILHDDIGDPDEANDNGTPGNDAPPADNPPGSPTSPIQQFINDGALRVTVTVTDSDGDSVQQQYNIGDQIVFQDDGPTIQSITQNASFGPELIANGSFESGHGLGGSDWNIFSSLTGGWTMGADGVPFEVQTGGVGGLGAHSGNALVELDADTQSNHGPDINPTNLTNATIQQTVATVAGETYQIEFWYAPRPNDGNPDSSSFKVLWNGAVVQTIVSDSTDEGWQKLTLLVQATGATSTLGFQGAGQANEFGAFIDDVSLKAVYTSLDDENTTLNPAVEVQGGPGDDGYGVTASGKINFTAGADGLKSIVLSGVNGLSAIYVNGSGIGTPEAISYQWVANGTGGTLYGLSSHFNTTGNPAFKISVDTSGNYVFTLYAPLNHPSTDNPQTDDVETSWEDNLSLLFGVTITDGDNDTVTGAVTINLDDDSPEFVFNAQTQSLGIEDADINAPDPVIKNLNLAFGADGQHATGGLKITAWPDLPGVTETLSQDGKTLTATIDGTPPTLLYTLVLNSNGTYTFTQANTLPGSGSTIFPTVTFGAIGTPVPEVDYDGFKVIGVNGDIHGSGQGLGVSDNNMNGGDKFAIAYDNEMTSATLGIRFDGNGTLRLDWVAKDDLGNVVDSGSTADFNADGTITITPSLGSGEEFFKLEVDVVVVTAPPGKPPSFKLQSVGGTTEDTVEIDSLTFQVTAKDGDGDTVSDTFQVDINNAPVITDAVVEGEVTESGDIAGIDEAGLGSGLEPFVALNATVTGALATLPGNPSGLEGVLATVAGQLGGNVAQAIAVVWDYLDDAYVSAGPNQGNINEAFVRLGVEYVEYLQNGGMPLVDVTAKFTADGMDAGSNPDRVQSLHDNLLGNLSTAALTQRFGGNPPQGDLTTLIQGVDADLLTRPYYSGNEGTSDASVRAWDVANGYVPAASGQLTATDVDTGTTLTWAITGPTTYGTMSIDASGKWTYVLNDADADTQALAQGQSVQQVYTATVTDEFGATDTVDVTITITGTNDAPVITLEGTDSDYAFLTETDAGLTATGTLSASDVDVTDIMNVAVTGVTAGGSGIENLFTNAELLSFFSVGVNPVIVSGATAGDVTWTFDSGSEAFNFVPHGWESVLNYTVQVTDSFGAIDQHVVQIKLHGTNDAPVITSTSGPAVAGAVAESGDIAGIDEAGLGGGLEPAFVPGLATSALLPIIVSYPVGLQAWLPLIAQEVGSLQTAIAVVWDYLDDAYVSAGPNQGNINEAFVRLGVEYVEYLQGGGMPLVDVTAKFTADGMDAGSNPDRVQSLHDNLLGNLSTAALTQRFGGNPPQGDLTTLIQGVDADLLTRPYYSGNEGTSDALVRAWDVANGYVPAASGQLTATDVDNGATQSWSISGPDTYGTMSIDASGKWTYVLNDADADTQALAQGQSVQQVYTATVTDEYGATDTVDVTITITGTNDAPVITGGVVTATLFEGGDLDNVVEAHQAADFKFEPGQNLDGLIQTEINTHPTDMALVLANVQTALGAQAGLADAIAAVWDNLDDHYTALGYYNTPVNEQFVRLGVEYAKYLAAGGRPLTDITVKFTPDDGDGNLTPERLQALHDNLLGNLNAAALQDRFGSNPTLYNELIALIGTVDSNLVNRPYYAGNEGEANAALPWDVANGYVPAATGQLTASDVDTGAVLTWSGDATGTYGSFSITTGGAWSYTLDDADTDTQGLAEGQTATDVFTATVSDGLGGVDTIKVTVTITGTNDAPVITVEGTDSASAFLAETDAGLTANGTLSVTDADVTDIVNVSVTGVTAGGSGIQNLYTPAQLLSFFSVGINPVIGSGATTGDITWTFDSGSEAFDFLPEGWESVLNYTVQVTDSFGAIDQHVVQIKLHGTNDGPVVDTPDTAPSTLEDTPVAITGFSVGDADDSTLTVTLSATSTLTLNGTNGLTFSAGDGTGDQAMTFSGTIADINAALNGMTYTPTPDHNGTGSISYVLNDGDETTNGSFTIDIAAVNDAPVNSVPALAQTTAEDTDLVFSDANGNRITVSDVDAGSNQIQVTLHATSGTFSLPNGLPGMQTFATNGFFTGTVAELNTWLNGLTFRPAPDYNGPASLQVTTSDFGATGSGGNQTDVDTISINVTPVNDGPQTNAGTGGGDEDSGPIAVSLSGADIDGTVTDFRIVSLPLDGTLYEDAGLTTILSAGSIVAAVGNAATVYFVPNLNANGTKTFQYAAIDDDNAEDATPATATITVDAVNDAPVNSVPAVVQTTAEDTDLVFNDTNGNRITVSDVDAGGDQIQVSLHAANGTFSLPNGLPGMDTFGTNGFFTGTVVQLNTWLDGLIFRPAPDYNGPASLQVTSSDFGATGSGGHLIDVDTILIDVTPVNDNQAPVITSQPGSGEVTEDWSYTVPVGERVANGSFEDDFIGWTAGGSATVIGSAHSGFASAASYLTAATLTQDIATIPGVIYRVSFWLSNPFDNGLQTENMSLTWDGQTVFSLGDVPPSGAYTNYTQYTVDVTATDATTTLSFAMLDTQGYWVLDDVSVVALHTPGVEITTGTISFTDVELADTHTVSYTPAAGGYYGAFAPVITDAATGDGTGQVTWTFTVDDADIQHLAAGQSVTQTYMVTIDDGHGGTISQDIDVLLHGTNDAPVAANDSIIVNGYTGNVPGTAASTPVFNEVENNNNRTQANVIDRSLLKIAPNANLGDATDPSITVKGSISLFNPNDYFAIDLKAGETLILDTDNTTSSLDTIVRLYRATGGSIASNDDSLQSLGGGGSAGGNGNLDSYLTYTATQDGTYYIEVTRYGSTTGSYDLQVSIDNFQSLQGGPISVPVAALLANDSDVDDGDALSVVSVSGSGVQLSGDGQSIAVQAGVSSFSYTVSDGTDQHTATVNVTQVGGLTSNGTGGADVMVGSGGNDIINGLGGNDLIFGGLGSDNLTGGDGDDTLDGGADGDSLTGGAGADRFKATILTNGQPDTITDYNFAEGDLLDLSGLLDSVFDPGDDISKFVNVSTAGGSDDLLVRVDTTGSGFFGSYQEAFLVAGAATGGSDPLKVFFDGTNHVLTG